MPNNSDHMNAITVRAEQVAMAQCLLDMMKDHCSGIPAGHHLCLTVRPNNVSTRKHPEIIIPYGKYIDWLIVVLMELQVDLQSDIDFSRKMMKQL